MTHFIITDMSQFCISAECLNLHGNPASTVTHASLFKLNMTIGLLQLKVT